MLPGTRMYTRALRDLFTHYGWTTVGVLYDNDHGSELAANMMEHLNGKRDLYDIRAYDVSKNSSADVARWALNDLRRKLVNNFLVLCSPSIADVVLTQALYLSLLSRPNSWLIVTLGSGDIDMTKYIDSRANLTLIRLMVAPFTSNCALPDSEISLTDAIFYDIFQIINGTKQIKPQDDDKVSRADVRRQIKSINVSGCTGPLNFTRNGTRNETFLQLIALEGLDDGVSGTWSSGGATVDKRVQRSKTYKTIVSENKNIFADKVLRVTTLIEKPFCMKKRDYDVRIGNDRFEGFAVDLIREVADMLDFKYELYLVHDGKFGSKRADGSWDGMIGELLHGNATMSVAPTSINSEREAAVDFTKPFMTRYISVLMRVPRSETSYFEFLNPLHPTVWFCTLGAFVFVSIVLYILERVGTVNREECPSISFKESFWFVFGSLLQGSTDSSPSTLPGRILTSSWWFFALILISSYTANLAAFLTVKKINTPIKSVTDLASQTTIKFGTVKSSGIMTFFKNTDIEHFSKMWAQMSEIEPSSMVSSTDEGFKKVQNEQYAFFWDTTVNKYKTIENCNFMEVGPPFDPKGFGIGVPPGATYREDLSMAILKLSDRGRLHELENRWWGRRNCPDHAKPSTDETSELQIDNVAGVFFILVGGIAFATVICILEYCAKQISNSVKKEKHARVTDKERESFL
ncbi:hypothetical protein ACF0H5_010856 [Mactra antiquata]